MLFRLRRLKLSQRLRFSRGSRTLKSYLERKNTKKVGLNRLFWKLWREIPSICRICQRSVTKLFTAEFFVHRDDFADVVLGFAVGGDAVVLFDGSGAGVICGEGKDKTFKRVTRFVGVFIEVSAQELDGAVEVLVGVVAIADAESAGGSGHELSEALSSGVGAGVGVEIRFADHEGHHEAGVNAVVGGVSEDSFGDILGFGGREFSVALLDKFGVRADEREKFRAETWGVFERRCTGFGDVAGEAGGG